MVETESPDSPLEAAAGVAGPRAIEAFSLLGNETWLSILLALWEVHEPFAEDNAVPFSELRDRVGMHDSGQFHYHLDKPAGHFVEKTDDGYELRHAGRQLVGTVIAGTGIEEPTLEPTELDEKTDVGYPTGSASSCPLYIHHGFRSRRSIGRFRPQMMIAWMGFTRVGTFRLAPVSFGGPDTRSGVSWANSAGTSAASPQPRFRELPPPPLRVPFGRCR